MSIAWSTADRSNQVLALSPSLRVLWAAYPGDPPATWPEARCLDGGVSLRSPQWLPFDLAFEEGGEVLRVDLAPARVELDAAFARLPGNTLTDATQLVRRAQHTSYVLRRLAGVEAAALQADARDLELRERGWASSSELANALQFLSKSPRGLALATQVEERLVLQAPFVMHELRLLDAREGSAQPTVFWREGAPCVAWGQPSRCVDPTTASTFATRGLSLGDSLRRRATMVHTPPSTIGGERDVATAVVGQGDRSWAPAQLIVSARSGRFDSAPADIVFSPSGAEGVTLVPVYDRPTCKPKRPGLLGLTNRFSCDATWRVVRWEVWAFSTRAG